MSFLPCSILCSTAVKGNLWNCDEKIFRRNSFEQICHPANCLHDLFPPEHDPFLWLPYVIGQAIIFLPCGFCLLSFFSLPNLSSRRLDVYHTSTWCGPNANLECRSEMCCTRLAGNTGHKKVAILAPLHKFVGLYLLCSSLQTDNHASGSQPRQHLITQFFAGQILFQTPNPQC